MSKKTKRFFWSDSVSMFDSDAQRVSDNASVIAALTGCDPDDVSDTVADDSLRGVWVRSNDDAMLRRFRRTR